MGIVSEEDLFLKRKRVPYTSSTAPALFDKWVRPEQLPELYRKVRQLTAADVMTREVVCVDIDDPVGEVARLMVERNLKRLPVLHDGKLAGMITRTNILTLLAHGDARAQLQQNDTIRQLSRWRPQIMRCF